MMSAEVAKPSVGWRDALEEHLSVYLGDFLVYHELRSEVVHLDLAIFDPRATRPFHTVVTMGVSDLPLNVPPELKDYRHIELMMYLPPDWSLDFDGDGEAAWWPFRMLKGIGRYVHIYETFYAPGHTVTNGHPPNPYYAGSNLTTAILREPLLESADFDTLAIQGEPCRFLQVMPITDAECAYKLENGASALVSKLNAAGVSPLIATKRDSVISGEYSLLKKPGERKMQWKGNK